MKWCVFVCVCVHVVLMSFVSLWFTDRRRRQPRQRWDQIIHFVLVGGSKPIASQLRAVLGRHAGVRPLSSGGRHVLPQSQAVQQKRRRGKYSSSLGFSAFRPVSPSYITLLRSTRLLFSFWYPTCFRLGSPHVCYTKFAPGLPLPFFSGIIPSRTILFQTVF